MYQPVLGRNRECCKAVDAVTRTVDTLAKGCSYELANMGYALVQVGQTLVHSKLIKGMSSVTTECEIWLG